MAHKNYFYERDNWLTMLASFGQFGLRILTGPAELGETFVSIQALEDSVISSEIVNFGNEIGDQDFENLELKSGMVIYGRFKDLDVVSGKVIAYKG